MKSRDRILLVLFILLVSTYILGVRWWYGNTCLDLAKTGQTGDTFGGLFSPLIGLLGLFFIIRTYGAQREQLNDQVAFNKVQTSLIYYTEFRATIIQIADQSSRFVYLAIPFGKGPSTPKESFVGKSAINRFLQSRGTTRSAIFQDGNNLLEQVNRQLQDLLRLIVQVEDQWTLLVPQHQQFILSLLIDLVEEVVPTANSVYRTVNELFTDYWEFNQDHNNTMHRMDASTLNSFDHQIKSTIWLYRRYIGMLNEMADHGFGAREPITNLAFDDFFRRVAQVNPEDISGLDLERFNFILQQPTVSNFPRRSANS